MMRRIAVSRSETGTPSAGINDMEEGVAVAVAPVVRRGNDSREGGP